MKTDRVLSALALARRAGKLIMGFDAVSESVEKKKTVLVVFAADLSQNTAKKAADCCERFQVEVVPAEFVMDEAEHVLGKRSGVFGVTDRGFQDLIRSSIGTSGEKTNSK